MSDRSTDLMRTLRAADPDRYLSMLYAPQDRRADLLALYAFNAEIAGIRDRVSEPMPGEIRLQWWRDMIDAGTPDNLDQDFSYPPVLGSIGDTIWYDIDSSGGDQSTQGSEVGLPGIEVQLTDGSGATITTTTSITGWTASSWW